ncbi:hypothetical protein D3C75_787100 [compost metagenome]
MQIAADIPTQEPDNILLPPKHPGKKIRIWSHIIRIQIARFNHSSPDRQQREIDAQLRRHIDDCPHMIPIGLILRLDHLQNILILHMLEAFLVPLMGIVY